MEAKLERPPWLMQRIPAGGDFTRVNELIQGLHLNTVCQSAHCPNIGECFGSGTATFLILGGSCTRRCTFCAVPKGEPQPVDPAEPSRIVKAALVMKLRHAVLTSVTRDDLSDGGAGHFAECIREFRRQAPETTVEVLTPDFCGSIPALATVLVERPDVFNHNIETVPRLYPFVRPLADYGRSLKVLSAAASAGIGVVKSGLMVGLGERRDEMLEVFRDLVAAGVTALTIGQYLRPSEAHLAVVEYVHPEQFLYYQEQAYKAGLKHVASGPLVRSSYHADLMVQKK